MNELKNQTKIKLKLSTKVLTKRGRIKEILYTPIFPNNTVSI